MQWSERPPAARSRFAWLGRFHCGPRSLSVAVAHFILVRRMSAFGDMEPVRAPHQTKYFWRFVVGLAVVVVCAPLVQRLMGYPPFPRHIQIRAGVIAFFTFVPLGWIAFRFGRPGWLGVSVALALFALVILFIR